MTNTQKTHVGSTLSQRDGKGAHAAASIAESFSRGGSAVLINPAKGFVDGLLVTSSDELLDGVDLVTVAINFAPPVEALIVEVLAHLCVCSGSDNR